MTTPEILDGIFRKQHEIGMTNQQLSDASSVPKASIERLKRGDTPNPTIETILALSAAVGFTFSNQPMPTPPIPETVKVEDPILKILLAHYEKQDIEHSEQMKRTAAHFNMLLAEKNRWIQTLSMIIGIMLTGLICILLIDIATPELGWFPHDASSIAIGLAITGVLAVVFFTFILKKKINA